MAAGAERSEASPDARSRWIGRAPLVAFAGVEIYALFLWLSIGKAEWFYADEWDFLAQRTGGNVGDLFRAHNGHWTTLPIIEYRILYNVFGVRAYLPYRLVTLTLYLIAAALLLVVMRRAGVHPWIATAAASLFVLFGAGWANIIRPFQVTFTGSLVFGLAALLLTDRDGPLGRRDLLGAVAGLAALMSSGVGVVMVVIVGATALLRRGWRVAVALVAPLAAVYLVWLVAIGHQGGVVESTGVFPIARFVWSGLAAGFRHLGPRSWFVIPLTVILIAGFLLAAFRSRFRSARLAAPVALVLGAVLVLAAAAAQGRAGTGSAYANQSRYVSLVAAMSLPALAVAVDALTSRWRWLIPVGMAVFLVAIPSNIAFARRAEGRLVPLYVGTRLAVETVPRDGTARTVPPSVQPDPLTAPGLTIGWLLGAVARHDVPRPDEITVADRKAADFRLSFLQGDEDATPHNAGCRTLVRPIVTQLLKGDEVTFSGAAILVVPNGQGPFTLYPGPVFSPARFGTALHLVRSVGRVRISASDATTRPRVCINRR